MSKLLYNGVELPPVPAHDADATVEVISAVLPAALSMYAQSPYILVIGKGTLWQSGKCYVRGVSAVYRLSGDAWMWHYGSGTVSAQDIVAANYFEAIWTNTDIPTADGAGIYLAASAPVDPNAPDEPEPEEPPVEPNVDVAAIYRRGWMDGFLSGINIRGILHRRTVEEPQPVTAYLYGTPSPYSDMVKYGGVELPNIETVWDKAACPYVFIGEYEADGSIAMICTSKPLQYGTWTSSSGKVHTYPHMVVKAGEIEARSIHSLNNGVWTSGSKQTFDRTAETTDYTVGFNPVAFWTNTDIPNIDNNTTYLAASEPVYSQVGGNVALADGEGYVLYNGAVLPKLPDWDKEVYPYAWITTVNKNGVKEKELICSSKKAVYNTYNSTTGILVYVPSSGTWSYCNMTATDGEWKPEIYSTQTGKAYMWQGHVLWTTTDIPNQKNGTTYLAATDPIPLASAEPVAAVYGGVKLPDIEAVWTDKTTYPFAFVYSFTNNGVANYILMLLPQVPYVGYLSSSTVRLDGCAVSATPHLKQYKSVAGVWEDQNFGHATASLEYYPASTPIIWASGDLAKTDGTVYLAASDPIPIYDKKE